MSPQEKDFKFLTECKLCQKFRTAWRPLNIPIVGSPDKRVFEYFAELQKHIAKKHPAQLNMMIGSMQELTGLLLTQMFHTEDPTIGQRAEQSRAVLVSQMAYPITDDDLVDGIARLNLDRDAEKQVIEFVLALRDALTCRGQHAPRTPTPQPPTPLIVA